HPALFAVLLEFLLIAAFILSMRGIDSALSAWKNWSYSVQALSRHPQLRLDQAIFIRTGADEASFVLGVSSAFAWLLDRLAVLFLLIATIPALALLKPLGGSSRTTAVVFGLCVSCLLLALFGVLLPRGHALEPVAWSMLGIAALIGLPGVLLMPFLVLLS